MNNRLAAKGLQLSEQVYFCQSFEEKVLAGLGACLTEKSGKCLIALSGGADSTAMTAAMAVLRERAEQEYSAQNVFSAFELYALHVNHSIRPPELCAVDEETAVLLCKKLNIPITVAKIPPGAVEDYAHRHGTGIEAAARHFRYKALNEEAKRLAAGAILTAHTADDRLETILMAFLKGSGPAGLGALSNTTRDSTDNLVLRPLLSLTRAEVLAYVKAQNLGYCSDETNDDNRFFRNKIRHVLIPLLDKEFPHWREPALRLGETQAMIQVFLAEEAEKTLSWRKATDVSLTFPAEQFFSAPEIIREEALFQALDKLALSNEGKKPRRDNLRSFVRGKDTAVDLGQCRLLNKNGRITVKKTEPTTHGFLVLIKNAGVYKLDDSTIIAGGQEPKQQFEQQVKSAESAFYAEFPLALRSDGETKIMAEDRHGRAAVLQAGKLVWKRECVSPDSKSIRFTIL